MKRAPVVCVVLVMGCGGTLFDAARDQGMRDLQCPDVATYKAENGLIVAHGCGRMQQYTCVYSGDGPHCYPTNAPPAAGGVLR